MKIIDRLSTLIRNLVQPANAHCDTGDGPVVTAGRRALAAEAAGSAAAEPALRSGQLVLTRSLRRAGRVRRGDLVVTEPAGFGRRVVKRIAGLPGGQVRFRDGVVSIDGAELAEPYATRSVYRGTFAVPSGRYLLLGDNRDASEDARSWQRPFVARSEPVERLVRPRPSMISS